MNKSVQWQPPRALHKKEICGRQFCASNILENKNDKTFFLFFTSEISFVLKEFWRKKMVSYGKTIVFFKSCLVMNIAKSRIPTYQDRQQVGLHP